MLKIYETVEEAQEILQRREMLTVADVPEVVLAGIERVFGEPLTPEAAVARLLAEVRARGDAALRDWTAHIDGLTVDALEVPPSEWKDAYDALDPELREALEFAAGRVRDFHARQPIPDWTTTEMGGVVGQRFTPIRRAGVYVPGGAAPLPSSLLMTAIPAQVAGVDEIIICTPPGRPDGAVDPTILAAAHIVGVDRLFRVGGALAVAALAFGSESIPRVDKIVGAGGLFTTIAKRQVYGIVGLDGLAGPTETMVIADAAANPAWVAADLLAQAEHDVLATAILLTPSRALAEAVQAEVERQIASLSRSEVLATSLAGQGGIVLTPDLATAARVADAFAAEHLCLAARDPQALMGQIRNAGGFFLGEHSCEVLGDYVAGPSHVMPTGGTARFAAPVNVLDFVKLSSIIALDDATAQRIAPVAARIARAESLTAHAAAADYRIKSAD
ncbi:MAG: histidinol dehydrogenase [Anaerolineales bacterium]